MANNDDIFSDEPPSLFDEEQYEPQVVDAPEYFTEEDDDVPPAMSGLCKKCLNTGFVHGVDNEGKFGVLYSEAGSDSSGKPKKSLVVCGHSLNIGY